MTGGCAALVLRAMGHGTKADVYGPSHRGTVEELRERGFDVGPSVGASGPDHVHANAPVGTRGWVRIVKACRLSRNPSRFVSRSRGRGAVPVSTNGKGPRVRAWSLGCLTGRNDRLRAQTLGRRWGCRIPVHSGYTHVRHPLLRARGNDHPQHGAAPSGGARLPCSPSVGLALGRHEHVSAPTADTAQATRRRSLRLGSEAIGQVSRHPAWLDNAYPPLATNGRFVRWFGAILRDRDSGGRVGSRCRPCRVFGSATSGAGSAVGRPGRAGGFAAPRESRPARRARPMLRSDGAGLVVVVLGAGGLADRLPVRMMAVEPRPHALLAAAVRAHREELGARC